MNIPNRTLLARTKRCGMSSDPQQHEPLADQRFLRALFIAARTSMEGSEDNNHRSWLEANIAKVLSRLGKPAWEDYTYDVGLPLVGQRVRSVTVTERYPHFSISEGATGVVCQANEDMVEIKYDDLVENADEWDNCISYAAQSGDLLDYLTEWEPVGDRPKILDPGYRDNILRAATEAAIAVGNAEAGVHAACLVIQDAVGQTDGGHAGMWWDGDVVGHLSTFYPGALEPWTANAKAKVRALFEEYLESEMEQGLRVVEEKCYIVTATETRTEDVRVMALSQAGAEAQVMERVHDSGDSCPEGNRVVAATACEARYPFLHSIVMCAADGRQLLREMEAAGVLFHLDDSPHNLVWADKSVAFTAEEAALMVLRQDELFDHLGDPHTEVMKVLDDHCSECGNAIGETHESGCGKRVMGIPEVMTDDCVNGEVL